MGDILRATTTIATTGAAVRPGRLRARRFAGLWRRGWLVKEPLDHLRHEVFTDGIHDFDVVRDDAGIVEVHVRP